MNLDEFVRPDLIQVQVTLEEELEASHADLHVRVRGTSLVTGRAALSKAREVAALAAALRAVGVQDAEIHLQDVSAEVSSGLLTKSSSATYGLKIRCSKLDTLADLLGAITSQKNTELTFIEWGYPEDDARRTAWLATSAQRATERAREIAKALGVELLGLHRFSEVSAPEHYAGPPGAAGGGMVRAKAGFSAQDLGLSIVNSKKVFVRTQAEFRIGPFAKR